MQKIKGTRSSYGGSEVLIYLHVKHVSTAAVAGSVRETPLSQTFLNTFSSQVVQRITQQTFKGLWALGMKETTNYFIQRLLLQKKHTLICITVKHLFRNRELTTMLNRLGHSETYRFALGLETAIAKVLQGSSNLLSTQIVVNPAAIAQTLQESSNLPSLQIVVNLAAKALPRHCRDLQSFCPLR